MSVNLSMDRDNTDPRLQEKVAGESLDREIQPKALPTPETPSVAVKSGSDVSSSGAAKKYTCNVCGHSFTRRHNLKSHQLIHTDARPFQCTECRRRFRRSHDLKRHQQLHLGTKEYKCDLCGKAFARSDALLRHKNSPSGCPGKGPRKHKRAKARQSPAKTSEEERIAVAAASVSAQPNLFSTVQPRTLLNPEETPVVARMYDTITMLQSKIKLLERKVQDLQS